MLPAGAGLRRLDAQWRLSREALAAVASAEDSHRSRDSSIAAAVQLPRGRLLLPQSSIECPGTNAELPMSTPS